MDELGAANIPPDIRSCGYYRKSVRNTSVAEGGDWIHSAGNTLSVARSGLSPSWSADHARMASFSLRPACILS